MWAVSHQKSDSRGWLFSSVLGCYQHHFWKVKFSSFHTNQSWCIRLKYRYGSVIVLILFLYSCGGKTHFQWIPSGSLVGRWWWGAFGIYPPTVHWLLANSIKLLKIPGSMDMTEVYFLFWKKWDTCFNVIVLAPRVCSICLIIYFAGQKRLRPTLAPPQTLNAMRQGTSKWPSWFYPKGNNPPNVVCLPSMIPMGSISAITSKEFLLSSTTTDLARKTRRCIALSRRSPKVRLRDSNFGTLPEVAVEMHS